MTSASKQIVEFLQNTYKEGEGFTSNMVGDHLPDVTKGSITGLLAKLLQKGYLKRAGTNGTSIVYSIAEDQNLSSYGIRRFKDPNYIPTFANRAPRKVGKQKILDTLFAVITELEKLKGDLSDFTTKEILHELEKRTSHTSE